MKILFAAQDPGGANALVPIIKSLPKTDQFVIYGALWATKIFFQNKLPLVNGHKFSSKKITQELIKFSPDCVVLGTSTGLSLEKKIITFAREYNIKTISIIDYWSNYLVRYSDPNTHNLKYLTDSICVIDERMKRECVATGLPRNRLRITGSPHLESSIKKITRKPTKKGQVLFISQPLSIPPFNTFPFTEFQVLDDLLAYSKLPMFKSVIVKTHPRENLGKFNQILHKIQKNGHVNIRLAKPSEDIYTLLNQSEIVMGINSMVLLEAGLAGRIVISYQPSGNKKNDRAVGNKMGVSIPCYSKKSLYRYFDRFFSSKESKTKHQSLYRQMNKVYAKISAVKNILTLIQSE